MDQSMPPRNSVVEVEEPARGQASASIVHQAAPLGSSSCFRSQRHRLLCQLPSNLIYHPVYPDRNQQASTSSKGSAVR
ncbi:hypothetical protein U9M48_010782 [Paspalum notatum var. saurae]|uniref:Uncharacterized protein n=1 Tax=Paspalum notatum var. saurae TaxID=547442 RepID=A0AAQ3WGM0_PASNO